MTKSNKVEKVTKDKKMEVKTHPNFKLRAVALSADHIIVFISLFSRGLFPYDYGQTTNK